MAQSSERHDAVVALMRRVAHDIVLPRFRNLAAAEIEEKAPDDLVTIADRESEDALTAGLAALDPAARIVGEEACAADPTLIDGIDRGRVWIIDPIDGTNNFAAGQSPFGIMIALVEDGVTQAGWILDPVSNRLCHAVRGGGAFIDGQRIIAQSSGAALPITAIATYFLNDEERADIARRADRELTLTAIPRCAAEQYPRLVLGTNDIALFNRTLPWDHAAGALFVAEAGGVVRRPDGSDYRVGDTRRGMIGAASPALWDHAARVLFG
ncbi:inositol monophosphatase [Sphingomonas sp. Leaf357]|uniref:inositol monophosphatase family protein n=1 Tax=Sphingomonas sp. Leaf357 TaxID=1736350 RepID=UPI0006F4919A|nr:inositol monophosphatase family protein [Sphingomonas sp. Leaf357]KQS04504.1 inositol monophosphatase [Sphingomonas sp. Leaf357]